MNRITRAEALAQGVDDRQLQHLVNSGALIRVRPGEFTLPEQWSGADTMARHRELVLRTAERVATPQVYAYHAAAALWGIRMLRGWPPRVDVLVERSGGGRSSGRLRRRTVGFADREVVDLHGLLVTSPAQTVVDLATELPFTDAVVAADSAIGTLLHRPPPTTLDELRERVAASGSRRRILRARAAIAEASPLSGSVAESDSRVKLLLLGFPRPELQHRFVTAHGTFYADFYWPSHGHVGECDGREKYADPRILGGRTPQEVFRAEKLREHSIRALEEVRGFSRWEPADLVALPRLYDRLVADGLPSRLPRPTDATLTQARAALLRVVR